MIGPLCTHPHLQLEPSEHAKEASYIRADANRRAAAETASGRVPGAKKKHGSKSDSECHTIADSTAYPAPLVLPDDDLALDPRYPPQSFRSWIMEKERNKVTQDQKTLYVAAAPAVSPELTAEMERWAKAKPPQASRKGKNTMPVKQPEFKDVVEYLSAFYHGMQVKEFPESLKFTEWEKGSTRSIGLQTGDSAVQIRIRPSRDGVFQRQLNLNDILDAAIEMLPSDAYAIILLVEHDMYEDEDDDFCCGRAYGGSRVAVVSSARYHPALDLMEGIDHAHMWPASHCKAYVDSCCESSDILPLPPPGELRATSGGKGRLQAAVEAASTLKQPRNEEDFHGLWLTRLVRTTSHELGHCLGLDHCVYYACAMQGTAGMAEDGRQPPYLSTAQQ
ncbi:hypothetical protein P152DRAFT_476047 [Eremomyces bilateralis CBS 781.70]|uniref:Zincin n=1 Tax=Eremomyces bilateralis CBS 781.70 TaxID=1392243 RepID=A0A6G1FVV2_9PEZI|nr:uncharacterized protein P152DRAFT_476047 [Eremomyces bilateralis CBS 781.70]KAF1809914.1 hypothetical protein P152DRAFT_476047 [Eremomyces bilateralis CBS 781.70]